jgi:hypothetical protein
MPLGVLDHGLGLDAVALVGGAGLAAVTLCLPITSSVLVRPSARMSPAVAQAGPRAASQHGRMIDRVATADLVGARNSATLRDLQIFVDGSAESVTTNDLGVGCFGLGECS